MKKLLYFFGCIALAAMIGSCGQTENGNGVDSDSIRTADSLAEVLRRDSIEWASFTSKDLTFFGVHGHVRTMFSGGVTYEFDSLGNWTKIDDVSPFGRKIDFYDSYSVYQRNSHGYIDHEEFWEGGGEYVWTDGRIVGENSFNCAYECRMSYEYDSLGNIGAVTMVESDDADGTKHDSNFYFAERHDVKADEPYVYTVTGVSLPLNDAHALSLFFDFGGSPVGTVVEISNITLIKE